MEMSVGIDTTTATCNEYDQTMKLEDNVAVKMEEKEDIEQQERYEYEQDTDTTKKTNDKKLASNNNELLWLQCLRRDFSTTGAEDGEGDESCEDDNDDAGTGSSVTRLPRRYPQPHMDVVKWWLRGKAALPVPAGSVEKNKASASLDPSSAASRSTSPIFSGPNHHHNMTATATAMCVRINGCSTGNVYPVVGNTMRRTNTVHQQPGTNHTVKKEDEVVVKKEDEMNNNETAAVGDNPTLHLQPPVRTVTPTTLSLKKTNTLSLRRRPGSTVNAAAANDTAAAAATRSATATPTAEGGLPVATGGGGAMGLPRIGPPPSPSSPASRRHTPIPPQPAATATAEEGKGNKAENKQSCATHSNGRRNSNSDSLLLSDLYYYDDSEGNAKRQKKTTIKQASNPLWHVALIEYGENRASLSGVRGTGTDVPWAHLPVTTSVHLHRFPSSVSIASSSSLQSSTRCKNNSTPLLPSSPDMPLLPSAVTHQITRSQNKMSAGTTSSPASPSSNFTSASSSSLSSSSLPLRLQASGLWSVAEYWIEAEDFVRPLFARRPSLSPASSSSTSPTEVKEGDDGGQESKKRENVGSIQSKEYLLVSRRQYATRGGDASSAPSSSSSWVTPPADTQSDTFLLPMPAASFYAGTPIAAADIISSSSSSSSSNSSSSGNNTNTHNNKTPTTNTAAIGAQTAWSAKRRFTSSSIHSPTDSSSSSPSHGAGTYTPFSTTHPSATGGVIERIVGPAMCARYGRLGAARALREMVINPGGIPGSKAPPTTTSLAVASSSYLLVVTEMFNRAHRYLASMGSSSNVAQQQHQNNVRGKGGKNNHHHKQKNTNDNTTAADTLRAWGDYRTALYLAHRGVDTEVAWAALTIIPLLNKYGPQVAAKIQHEWGDCGGHVSTGISTSTSTISSSTSIAVSHNSNSSRGSHCRQQQYPALDAYMKKEKKKEKDQGAPWLHTLALVVKLWHDCRLGYGYHPGTLLLNNTPCNTATTNQHPAGSSSSSNNSISTFHQQQQRNESREEEDERQRQNYEYCALLRSRKEQLSLPVEELKRIIQRDAASSSSRQGQGRDENTTCHDDTTGVRASRTVGISSSNSSSSDSVRIGIEALKGRKPRLARIRDRKTGAVHEVTEGDPRLEAFWETYCARILKQAEEEDKKTVQQEESEEAEDGAAAGNNTNGECGASKNNSTSNSGLRGTLHSVSGACGGVGYRAYDPSHCPLAYWGGVDGEHFSAALTYQSNLTNAASPTSTTNNEDVRLSINKKRERDEEENATSTTDNEEEDEEDDDDGDEMVIDFDDQFDDDAVVDADAHHHGSKKSKKKKKVIRQKRRSETADEKGNNRPAEQQQQHVDEDSDDQIEFAIMDDDSDGDGGGNAKPKRRGRAPRRKRDNTNGDGDDDYEDNVMHGSSRRRVKYNAAADDQAAAAATEQQQQQGVGGGVEEQEIRYLASARNRRRKRIPGDVLYDVLEDATAAWWAELHDDGSLSLNTSMNDKELNKCVVATLRPVKDALRGYTITHVNGLVDMLKAEGVDGKLASSLFSSSSSSSAQQEAVTSFATLVQQIAQSEKYSSELSDIGAL